MEDAPQSDDTALPADNAGSLDESLAFWTGFGFEPELSALAKASDQAPADHPIYTRLPRDVVAFTALKGDASALGALLDGFPIPEMLSFGVGDRTFCLFRVEPSVGTFETPKLPSSVLLLQQDDMMPLPMKPFICRFNNLSEIAAISLDLLRQAVMGPLDPEIPDSPLSDFSLLGHAAEFEQMAIEATPLLGNACLKGQATIFYAPPNGGKTLITLKLLRDAVTGGRINPANVYYINADDSSEGFATKMRLMDELGVHTLAPGHKGFHASSLADALHEAATKQKAQGSFIIIDTMKKFTTLMDKNKVSAFTGVCRHYVMAGGTILALAHTTKSPNANGSLRYAGTTDVVDDFDAAYTITPIGGDRAGEKIALFENFKRRGNNALKLAYAYADDGHISYEERLASVREVDPGHLEGLELIEAQRTDTEVICTVAAAITDGVTTKMALAKETARRQGISERAAIRVIEAYTGSDPSRHRWTYAIKERGAKVFTLLIDTDAKAPPPTG